MTHTAKKTGFVMHDKHMDIVEYEYRCIKYEVRYAKDWSMSLTSPSIQHQDAQERIDKMLDQKTETQAINMDEIWAMYEA